MISLAPRLNQKKVLNSAFINSTNIHSSALNIEISNNASISGLAGHS